MKAEHLPGGLAHVAAGINVVTHEHKAVIRQTLRGEREERVAHGRRHPGVHAMGDDEVE